jgi:hypothetical protein
MPIRPELRPLYPPHWRELSRRVRFESAEGSVSVAVDHTSPASAASRTGVGMTTKRGRGGTGADEWLDGPTWLRPLDFG